MAKQPIRRIRRKSTAEERARHAELRTKVEAEFAPKRTDEDESPIGIPAKIRSAREQRGLTWHALAEKAGLADSGLVRDIESGRDVPVSAVEAVAKVLGLKLELVQVS